MRSGKVMLYVDICSVLVAEMISFNHRNEMQNHLTLKSTTLIC